MSMNVNLQSSMTACKDIVRTHVGVIIVFVQMITKVTQKKVESAHLLSHNQNLDQSLKVVNDTNIVIFDQIIMALKSQNTTVQ